MLGKKKFKFFLTGRINNDPIEYQFCLIQFLSSDHLALHASTSAHNEWVLLLRLVTQLCINADGSYDKNLHKSFFHDAHSITE